MLRSGRAFFAAAIVSSTAFPSAPVDCQPESVTSPETGAADADEVAPVDGLAAPPPVDGEGVALELQATASMASTTKSTSGRRIARSPPNRWALRLGVAPTRSKTRSPTNVPGMPAECDTFPENRTLQAPFTFAVWESAASLVFDGPSS